MRQEREKKEGNESRSYIITVYLKVQLTPAEEEGERYGGAAGDSQERCRREKRKKGIKTDQHNLVCLKVRLILS